MTSLLCLMVSPAGCGPCDLPAGVLWLKAATCNTESRVRHDAHRTGEMWADLYRYRLPCSGVTCCCCSPLVWGCFFCPEGPEASWDHEMPLKITLKLMIMSFIFVQKVEKDSICVWEGWGKRWTRLLAFVSFRSQGWHLSLPPFFIRTVHFLLAFHLVVQHWHLCDESNNKYHKRQKNEPVILRWLDRRNILQARVVTETV